MDIKKEIIAQLVKNVKHREAATKRIEAEIEKLYKKFFSRLKSLVLSGEILSKSEIVDLTAQSKMISQLDAILKDAGLDKVIQQYRNEFPDITKNAVQYFNILKAEPNLAGFSQESFKAYINYSENQLVKLVGAKLIAPIQSGIIQANFGNETRDSIINKVLSLEETLTVGQAANLVNDSFAQYQRAVTVQIGEEIGAEVYIYVGPDDDLTSQQCQDMLNFDEHDLEGYAYKDEINQNMVDGLTDNPLIAGGHINCRHEWVPITLDYAISQGFVP